MRTLAAVLLLGFLPGPIRAEEFSFTPEPVAYDPSVPALESVVGHRPGERISDHAETLAYGRALAAASDRVAFFSYGESWERRELFYLVVGSRENLARLDAIREGMRRLADPRELDEAEARRLISELPAIAWMSYCVHGDESSGTDAGLLLAYHLAAATDDPVASAIRDGCLVIVDPLQNPDGRDRFVHHNRRARGRLADPDPQAAEHDEPWPSGRVNHYLFDMNRDWFALTQPETRGRIRAYLEWMPQVFADVHEMGGESSYYFPPAADPINPHMRSGLVDRSVAFGRNNARWFDRMGFDYFTREVFDSFFPGYGESWPYFHGAVGMTFEMASTSGLVRQRRDDRVQHYRDAVQRHFIASLATGETAATQREELLGDFFRARRLAVEDGKEGPTREYLLEPGPDPGRTDRLVALLLAQGVEVERALEPFHHRRVRDYDRGDETARTFPAGTYRIPLAQPARPLVVTLFDPQTDMDPDFVAAQRERVEERRGYQIYDITGWSLPYLFDVRCYRAGEASEGAFEPVAEPPATPGGAGRDDPATVAWLLPWGTQGAARALVALFRKEIRVSSAGRAFVLDGDEYPAGSLIVRSARNPEDLAARLREIGEDAGVTFHPTDTSWVEDGPNFGSGNVRFLHAPRVALAWGSPASPTSTGATRYVLEQRYGLPVTALPADAIARADLDRYDVLILPNGGGFGSTLGEQGSERLARWVREGGTLVGVAGAVRYLTSDDAGLLPIEREKKETPEADAREADIRPEVEYPTPIPGAILRVALDSEHWLAHGYDGDAYVLADSRAIYTPIRLDSGRNVGRFEAKDRLLASGFAWDETLDQLAGKPFLVHRPLGRGHVIAFTEDPSFRASVEGLDLLLLNAVLRGPSF